MDDEPAIEAVLAAAADGSEQAWTDIVERYAPLVSAVVRRHRLYADDSQDVFQTVWLRLVEHLGSLREPRALPGWLVTTTRHECLRVIKARQRSTPRDPATLAETEDDTGSDDMAEGLVRQERHDALLAAFAELPHRHRQLLQLLLADPPLSYAEIAERLDVSIGSIGPTRSRALERLRRSAAMMALQPEPEHQAARGGGGDDDATQA